MTIEIPTKLLNGHRTNGVDGLHTNRHHKNGHSNGQVHKANGKNGVPQTAQVAPGKEAENPYATPPQESYDPAFESLVSQMLARLGEDPERDGLKRTPLRVAKAMDFLTSGYKQSLAEVVNGALFEAEGQEMVIVRDIEFYSQCEHHMLPFFGKAHIGYIPNGNIIGLSKLARIVDVFARRLQVQERLTGQVADALMEILQPQGVAVVTEASHFCMMMRGVQKQNSFTISSAMRGVFKENATTRGEFMDLVTHNR
jgi:GTP cyclohydrolase I